MKFSQIITETDKQNLQWIDNLRDGVVRSLQFVVGSTNAGSKFITNLLYGTRSVNAAGKCQTQELRPDLRLFASTPLGLLFALLLCAPVAGLKACDFDCSFNYVAVHPPLLLQRKSAELGIEVTFEGDLLEPIDVNFEGLSVDEIVKKTAEKGGYLLRRSGKKYTLFGDNVEEVVIPFTPRHISADQAADHIQRFEDAEILVLSEANTIIVRGSSAQVRRAQRLFRTIDVEAPNVFLELMVVEYFHGDGYTWTYNIIDGTKGKISDGVIAPGAGTISASYEAIADLPKTFRASLTALVEENEAKVITNPHIAVRSGQVGELRLQEELNIILTNETSNFGVTRALEKLEAGVNLSVTPLVLDEGYIDLQLKGEVSVFVPAPQGEFAIDRQNVTTRVLVKSGETLVIGGLVAKQGSVTDSGVPGLRKIPVLGYLFKSQTRKDRYIETVLYITPYINDPDFFLPENIDRDVDEEFGNTLSID